MPRYQDTCCLSTFCSRVTEFPCMGSCTWTVPSGVTRATFEIWGGGGGGAAKCCCACYHSGPGGAGGGYARTSITVAPGATYSICVGGGGMQCVGGACAYHWCCYGNPGCTSYVTGTGLSNFCATGGDGGTNTCYAYCGCLANPGCGYGGSLVGTGSAGFLGGADSNQCQSFGAGGTAPGTNHNRWFVQETCNGCMVAAYGTFPGGGGATVNVQCCCCSQGGVGANGLVRIYF